MLRARRSCAHCPGTCDADFPPTCFTLTVLALVDERRLRAMTEEQRSFDSAVMMAFADPAEKILRSGSSLMWLTEAAMAGRSAASARIAKAAVMFVDADRLQARLRRPPDWRTSP